jgi:erythromycin esterase
MNDYLEEIINGAHPLVDKEGIGPLIASIKDKKIVMLGEASHGTKEFYEWRQLITQELIMNHGFNFVAVEGDWPPCQKINRFVSAKESGTSLEVLTSFKRWPTWMWSNHEVLWFVDWLKEWNKTVNGNVGFHGLDVYSFYESMDQVITMLQKVDPKLAEEAEKKYSCLESYRHNEISYAKSLLKAPAGCTKEILDVLNSTLRAKIKSSSATEDWFDIRQNAKVVKEAENYYRAMVTGDEDTWNIRDNHMMSTLEMLLEHYGVGSKTIVWEHNTHIGDYRATDMVNHGQVNIGGLAREIFGQENVSLVGFGTYSGTVTASNAWDGPTTVFDVPEAKPGSVEHACHSVIANVASSDFYLLFDPFIHGTALTQVKGHRAIGVVYDPDFEHRGNYVPTSLANRYDAFIFLDHTNAIAPLNVPFEKHRFPETYPHGNRI